MGVYFETSNFTKFITWKEQFFAGWDNFIEKSLAIVKKESVFSFNSRKW